MKAPVPVPICLTFAFVSFAPFMVHGFSTSSSKCLSWWSIQDIALFLLSLSTLSRKVTLQLQFTYASERYCKTRSSKQVKNCSSANSSQASWKPLCRVVSRNSIVHQQSTQRAITCSYHGNTPDTQTAYQRSRSSGHTYLHTGHQTMTTYWIMRVAYFNPFPKSFLAHCNIETFKFCF